MERTPAARESSGTWRLLLAMALASYPASEHASLHEAVRHGFISAPGTTMELSFVLVVVGIVLTLLLISAQPAAATDLKPPNMVDPFSGLAPRP